MEPTHALDVSPDALAVAACGVAAAAVLASVYGPGLLAVAFGLLCALLVPIVVIDLRELRIPNRLVGPGVAVGSVMVAAVTIADGRPSVAAAAPVGAMLFVLPLLVVHLVSPAGLGFGDVKLGVLLGLALGLAHPVLAPLGLALGCLLEVVRRVARQQWRGAEPFAPALALGTIVTLAAGPALVPALGLGWSW